MGTDVAELGYLALPETGSGAGVVVLQEWWGLVPHIKSISDRFAAAGFVALAPDLYGGQSTTSPDAAGRMMMALNIEQTAQDLEKAIAYLLDHPAVTSPKVGVVGFCMGGQLALLAATLSDRVGAVIDFYGIHPSVDLDVSKLQAPVLAFFGGQDASVPLETAEALVARIRHANKPIEAQFYAAAGHAFFNDARPEAYNPAAAADAWPRSVQFFEQHLATSAG